MKQPHYRSPIRNQGLLLLSALMSILNTSPARAASAPQKVIEVSTDAIKAPKYHFDVTTDFQGDLDSLIYAEGLKPARTFTVHGLHDGIILLHNSDYDIDVVTMRADNDFDPQHGGMIHLKYVFNAIRHKFAQFDIELLRNGAQWTAYRMGEDGLRAFDHLFLKANHLPLVGTVVGIENINAW